MITGLTRHTLSEIAGNIGEIVVAAASEPDPNGKWRGWITHGPAKHFRPLLNTPPQFATAQEATAAMQRIVDAAPGWTEKDMEDPENLLRKYFLPVTEEAIAVRRICAAAAL